MGRIEPGTSGWSYAPPIGSQNQFTFLRTACIAHALALPLLQLSQVRCALISFSALEKNIALSGDEEKTIAKLTPLALAL